MKTGKWTLSFLLALGLATPSLALANGVPESTSSGTTSDTTTDTTLDSQSGMSEDTTLEPDTSLDSSTSGTTTDSDMSTDMTTEPGTTSEMTTEPEATTEPEVQPTPHAAGGDTNVIIEQPAPAAAAVAPAAAAAAAAPAAAATTGKAPRWWPAALRVIPVAGASSFTTSPSTVEFDNFDDSFTTGAFVDFGGGHWTFETGFLAFQTSAEADPENGTAAFNIDSWGIPLLAKFNFSGHAPSTFYLKLGAMPFQPQGSADDQFDVLAHGGAGAAIPLFKNTALTLEASYSRLFDDTPALGAYQGVTLLGGISFGM